MACQVPVVHWGSPHTRVSSTTPSQFGSRSYWVQKAIWIPVVVASGGESRAEQLLSGTAPEALSASAACTER